MANPHWRGVFPAAPTQFREDQSLDVAATARHWQVLIDSGIGGLIVGGSLGESQLLDAGEKRALVTEAVKCAAGRLPVLSGVAEMSTAAACQYVRDSEKLGVSGFMVMPAMVYKADEREAAQHFRRVGAATSLPWMLYNNPVAYPVDVTPSMFVELADVANLVAIKESTANTRRITELRIAVGDRYALFVGIDAAWSLGGGPRDLSLVLPAPEARFACEVRAVHQARGSRGRVGA